MRSFASITPGRLRPLEATGRSAAKAARLKGGQLLPNVHPPSLSESESYGEVSRRSQAKADTSNIEVQKIQSEISEQ